MAIRVVDSGHEYRDVRSHRATPDRPCQGEKSARRIEPAGIRSARQAPAVQGQVRRVDFRPLHRGDHPPRPGAHARAVRAGSLRRCEHAARRGRADRDTSRSGADRGAGGGRDRERGFKAYRALRTSPRFRREPPLPRADRKQIPHLCGGRAEPIRDCGDDRGNRASGKPSLGAKAHEHAPRIRAARSGRPRPARRSARLTDVPAG